LIHRVDELEEYNANLHEEFHALYNGVGPYAPLDAASMDIDDEEEDEPIASPRGDGDVSDPNDSPEE
jgi:regulator of RNase E activity RraB